MKFQNYLTVFRKNGCSEIFIKISRKVLMVEFGFNPNMGGRGWGGGGGGVVSPWGGGGGGGGGG